MTCRMGRSALRLRRIAAWIRVAGWAGILCTPVARGAVSPSVPFSVKGYVEEAQPPHDAECDLVVRLDRTGEPVAALTPESHAPAVPWRCVLIIAEETGEETGTGLPFWKLRDIGPASWVFPGGRKYFLKGAAAYTGEGRLLAGSPMDGDRDHDGDGMTDGYEMDNGLDPTSDDAGEDSDGDGAPNGEEFAAGTRADAPDSAFRILGVEPCGGGVRVRWSSLPGKRYGVLHGTAPAGTYLRVAVVSGGAGAETSRTVPVSSQEGFIRVEIVP